MDKPFYLQGGEEEMEFMPIIPLNDRRPMEADADPGRITPLPLRNNGVSRRSYTHYRWTDKSIKAVKRTLIRLTN